MNPIVYIISIPLIIVLNSLFILGLNYAARPGKILHSPASIIKYLPSILSSPIIGCVECMASFWGVFGLAVAFLVLDMPFFIAETLKLSMALWIPLDVIYGLPWIYIGVLVTYVPILSAFSFILFKVVCILNGMAEKYSTHKW